MLNVHLLQEGKIMRKLFFVMFLLSSTLIFAQNKVTGVVTDKSGMPLIGVNVVEKVLRMVILPMSTESILSTYRMAKRLYSRSLALRHKK